MGAVGWVRSWVAARCEGAARKVEWDAEMFRRAGRGGRMAQLVWIDRALCLCCLDPPGLHPP